MAVEAINRAAGLVLMADGSTVPVTNWLDADGDECDWQDARVAVAGPASDGRWHMLDLDDFEEVETH